MLNTVSLHPVLLGEYAALVFSGSRARLGEWPNEPTALTSRKYVLPDPRRMDAEDYAHGLSDLMDTWPHVPVEPAPGVCFVFDDAEHPYAQQLRDAGGMHGEDFVYVDDLERFAHDEAHDASLQDRLRPCAGVESIVLLGFGDQGSLIAPMLRGMDDVVPESICVVEDFEVGRRVAASMGLRAVSRTEAPASCDVVVYSPITEHRALADLYDRLVEHGAVGIDNRVYPELRPWLQTEGAFAFEPAAQRCLFVDDDEQSARVRSASVPVVAQIARHVMQPFGDSTMHALRTGMIQVLSNPTEAVTVRDGAGAVQAVTVGVTHDRCLAAAAAHAFGTVLWPQATQRILPTANPWQYGQTVVERLLQRHIRRFEVAPPSQTTAQMIALAITAAHYATDAPIVEIGSALGGSGLLMAAATQSGQPIISVDPGVAYRDVMRYIFEREHLGERLEQIVKPSDEAVADLAHLHESCGLVFIDGLHTEDQTRRDYFNYAPLVKPGGALLMHDVDPVRPSVIRVALEIAADERFETMAWVDGLIVYQRRP
jgi:predicted O-methyltransferase YrrM